MIYLFGASGHAKVIIESLELSGMPVGGIRDDNPAIKKLLEYEVSTQFPLAFDAQRDEVIVSIGNNRIRKKIVNFNSFNYATVTHPSAVLSKRSRIGKGTVVMAGVSVNSGAQIGDHVILNTNCSIDHDCLLEDYVHISPNAALAGDVTIGEGTHIGIGACVIQGIRIGRWCTIGAGTVIIQDIPDGSTVVGNPGRIIKTDNINEG